ncbi:MAG: iron chaperone [Gaiellaceae bacterium]
MTEKMSKGFSAAEKAAMKQRAAELKAEARKVDGERILLARVAELKGKDRAMARRIHEIVKANAPSLLPKTRYGMPAWANADGKVVCYFQDAAKFDSRYATFGFNDEAKIDAGTMWPTSFALLELTPADEKKIAALVKKAVG